MRGHASHVHTPGVKRCIRPSTILLLSAALPALRLWRTAEVRGGCWWALLSPCAMARPMRPLAHRRREVLAHLPLAPGPQPTRASAHTLLRGKESPMRDASEARYRPLRQARPRGGVGVKDNLLPRFPSGPAALATCAPQKRRLLGRSLWAGVGGGGSPAAQPPSGPNATLRNEFRR